MPAAPPSRWKRRIRRILVALLLSPILLWALANAFLATPWARDYLGRKLSARLGVEAVVGRVTFTPWDGVAIGDLRCLQPSALRESIAAPLLEVDEIRFHPQWSRLLRGEPGVSLVRIERPRLTLSVEMAASMVAAGATTPAPAVVAAPPVASTDGPQAPVAPEGGPTPAAPSVPGGVAAAPAPVSVSAIIGTTWVEIVDAGADLWFSGSRLVSFRGVEGKIPFAGAPAFSKLQLSEVEVLGQMISRDLAFPLSWRAPELRCDTSELRLAELQVKLSAALGVMPGAPFAIDISVPPQGFQGTALFPNGRPGAARVEARVQGLGLARHPSTWQGLAVTGAEAVTMQLGGEPLSFDEGRVTMTLQGGLLVCPDVRLTGERASLLGNGQIAANGQGTAVLRVVVPPDVAATWTRRLTIGEKAPAFAPLETPDRMFIDLRWIPYSGGQGIELGEGGPIVPAAEFVKLLSGG